MTCASCELLLERKLKAIPGITHVDINHRTGIARLRADSRNLPDEDRIRSVIHGAGYSLADERVPTVSSVDPDKRKWIEIGASLLVIFALYKLLQAFDIVSLVPSTSGALSFGGILVIGLVAGTSSCLAVAGGLLIAIAAKYNQVHHAETAWDKFKPLLQFNIGRLGSYFVLGGLVGLLGQSITLSTKMTGYMSIVIAIVMLYLALTILQIIPKGGFPIRPPKKLSHWIAGLSESKHPAAPFTLGALTFFLPCGFTQSLQLVALASGNFVTGALTMSTFALGTLPSLLGISAISSTAKGSSSRLFLRFAGTFVFVLALGNINSGFALTGINLAAAFDISSNTPSASAHLNGNVQQVSMKVTANGYVPSNLTITAGVPVKWLIDGAGAGGCTSQIVIPSLNIMKSLSRGINEIDFTAPNPGRLAFSCSMGMVRGSFTVL
jgi:sulfite exporter TauE/SafE/copper chaperone CopZ